MKYRAFTIANELIKEAITGLEAESAVILVVAGARYDFSLIEHKKAIGTVRAKMTTGSELYFDASA